MGFIEKYVLNLLLNFTFRSGSNSRRSTITFLIKSRNDTPTNQVTPINKSKEYTNSNGVTVMETQGLPYSTFLVAKETAEEAKQSPNRSPTSIGSYPTNQKIKEHDTNSLDGLGSENGYENG